jgi:TPR repeat protein
MYSLGRGVQKNLAEAFTWFLRAAEAGQLSAQHSLGNCYATGQGIERSDVQAVRWLRSAAEQGYDKAQVSLGHMCAEGRGIDRSEAEAVRWFREAAKQGNAEARRQLVGRCLEYALVPGQESWWLSDIHEMAKAGNAKAQLFLGLRCATWVNSRDDAEAVSWFQAAARAGSSDAIRCLELVALTEPRSLESDAKVAGLSQASALAEDPESQFNIGMMYATGVTLKTPRTKLVRRVGVGERLFRVIVASDADDDGCNALEPSQRVPRLDYAEAAKWYQRAAEQGHVRAHHRLWDMYRSGRGVPKDLTLALAYLIRACVLDESGRYVPLRDNVAAMSEPRQLRDAQFAALEWLSAYRVRKSRRHQG